MRTECAMRRLLEENRVRLYLVAERDVLRAMTAHGQGSTWTRPKLKSPPDDAFIHRVWHDAQRMAFVFAVSHESFEQVPMGGLPRFYGDEIVASDEQWVRVDDRSRQGLHEGFKELINAGGSAAPAKPELKP